MFVGASLGDDSRHRATLYYRFRGIYLIPHNDRRIPPLTDQARSCGGRGVEELLDDLDKSPLEACREIVSGSRCRSRHHEIRGLGWDPR